MNPAHAIRILEAALLSSVQPLTFGDLQTLLGNAVSAEGIQVLMGELRHHWDGRGLELVEVDGGWRFQTHANVRAYVDRLHPEKPAKFSRAALETLAVIAYRQPVTRGDIEDIRGVAVNSHLLRQLEERGWVDTIGHRDTPGRPALLATTHRFLQDFGLASLDELPALDGRAESNAGHR